MQVIWLIHHHENPPNQRAKAASRAQEDLVDRHVPELLFYMEELRGLVKKYNQVIQRYYVQYLSGYDAVALNQCIHNLHHLTDDESILLSSISQSISHLTVDQVEDPEHTFDFRGLRLDWTRLQSYLSCGGAKSKLDEFKTTGNFHPCLTFPRNCNLSTSTLLRFDIKMDDLKNAYYFERRWCWNTQHCRVSHKDGGPTGSCSCRDF